MAERRDESFLARWSRRKQAAREVGQQPPGRAEPQAPAPARDAGASAREPAVPGRKAVAPAQAPGSSPPELPDPATLDASADFSVFLGRNVPIETHRAALRRLWRLDPFYNRHDGLSDYCEDFTDQATVVKGLRTAYRVGRSLLERAAKPAADATAPASPAKTVAGRATPALPPPSSERSDESITPAADRNPPKAK
jgi:hypothetical protein